MGGLIDEVQAMSEIIYVIADCSEEDLYKTVIEYIKKLMFEIPKYPFKTDCTVIRIFDAKSKAEDALKWFKSSYPNVKLYEANLSIKPTHVF